MQLKNKKIISSFSTVLVFAIGLLIYTIMNANESAVYSNSLIDDPYVYTYTVESKEWKAATSLYDKIQLCKVDEEVLKSMTTKALVQTVLNYPLLANMFLTH